MTSNDHIHQLSFSTAVVFEASSATTTNAIADTKYHSISHRQAAEFQLEILLKESEHFVPFFIRNASASLSEEREFSIEEISKMLNAQTFIVDRLIHAVNFSAINGCKPLLNRFVAQKLTRILNSTIHVRSLIFFKMLDENNDQYVDRDELSRFYDKYLNNMNTFDKTRIPLVIQLLLKRYQLDTKYHIDYDEFYSIVTTDQALLESFSLFSVRPTWFTNKNMPQSNRNPIQRCCAHLSKKGSIYEKQAKKLSVDYLKNNLPRITVILLYILINLGLTLYVIIYRAVILHANGFIVCARIGGMLLNFNCSFVIVLMLKQTILLIRTTALHRFLPIDDHISFHKFVGRFIGALSIFHTVAHMINFAKSQKYPWVIYMFTTRPGIGWMKGLAPLSGVILCAILTIIVIDSMHWVRRGGYFQIFYWSHHLYIPFLVLLIMHARNFWKWVVGPLTLLVLEKFYSVLTRYSSDNGRTYLVSATIEKSNVINLMIHRPKKFRFKPGDYILINLPRVALYEFHPFTISSAPEETNHLRVHIQAVGNWTKLVYKRFKDMAEENNCETDIQIYRKDLQASNCGIEETIEIPSVTGSMDEVRNRNLQNSAVPTVPAITLPIRKPKEVVIVNGPYSSCARYIFDCKHVVLIGSGIGITPYASILSSLMNQFRASRTICKHCHRINYDQDDLWQDHRLKKVDFIWVNRDSKNFEWFIDLLCQFEKEQAEYLATSGDEQPFLTIKLYFTGIKREESIDQVFLHQLTSVWAKETGCDMFTGLKSSTRFGRPDWNELFQSLISHDNTTVAKDVDVFFCGPKAMGKEIRQHCENMGVHYFEENF